MWGDTPAIGQRFIFLDHLREVVGVAEDGKYHAIQDPPQPVVYLPLSQSEQWLGTFVVRSDRARNEMAAAVLGVMGMLAAMVAVTGIFGMAAYNVSRRMRELGIRVALGARTRHVMSVAVGRPIVLLGVGSLAGLLLGVFASRLLE